jgi:hypothetical protein
MSPNVSCLGGGGARDRATGADAVILVDARVDRDAVNPCPVHTRYSVQPLPLADGPFGLGASHSNSQILPNRQVAQTLVRLRRWAGRFVQGWQSTHLDRRSFMGSRASCSNCRSGRRDHPRGRGEQRRFYPQVDTRSGTILAGAGSRLGDLQCYGGGGVEGEHFLGGRCHGR